jgi:carbon monoxide dehydrogenase subunit G
MAMEISKSFVVKAPPDAVWSFLTDPVRVARCLPGAAITGQVDDRTHAGTITVKVGPVAATYKGTMRFEQLDPAARTADIIAAGQDVRGKGGADMRMRSSLVERAPGETEVSITSQVNVMGILAQFGRGMIQDVSDQMFGTFVATARAELEKAGNPATPPTSSAGTSNAAALSPSAAATSAVEGARKDPANPPPPIEVLSFGSAVVGRAAARAARNAIVWVVILIVLGILYAFWLR